MGNSTWSANTYMNISSGYTTKSTQDIFTNKRTDKKMDPVDITFRESRDSVEHPETLPIAFFLDVTGSMGKIPESLIRGKLGSLMNTLIAHGIDHPQILFGAIGDHHCDKSPLQIGQYESGPVELDNWLQKMHIEAGGGGQQMESYLLAWLFCARHTSIDSFEKRGQKGFLFTCGDEWTWDTLSSDALKSLMGYKEAEELTHTQLLAEAKRMYHVFHIHVNEASYKDDPHVIQPWKDLLGERLIICDHYETIAEIVAATVAVIHGIDLKTVVKSFDDHTANVVSNALAHVQQGVMKQGDTGIMAL